MHALSVLMLYSSAAALTYDLPDSWYTSAPECNNNLQSPINLETTASEAAETAFLKLWIPRMPLTPIPVQANGPALVIDLSSRGITLTGFWAQYTLQEMRYHAPSEHVIEGVRYPLERQLKFRPSDYYELQSIDQERSPIVIISELYTRDDSKPDIMLDGLLKAGLGSGSGGSLQGGVTNILQSFKPSFNFMKDEFFVYPGSLTIPPCSEVVTWHVSSNLHTISGDQRLAMDTIIQGLTGVSQKGNPPPTEVTSLSSDSQTLPPGNARPLQNVNGRTIKKQRFYSLD